MKLIPKYQSPWAPINYKPPENNEEYRVVNTSETHDDRSTALRGVHPRRLNYTVGNTKSTVGTYSGGLTSEILQNGKRNDGAGFVSGTDPVGEFYVAGEALGPLFKGLGWIGKLLFPYAARFTSGSVRNWIASKSLSNVMNSDALTGGVNRVVLNNGNILLQLTSHSSRKPRQLRIEPLGNNAFRVHASTWGGLTDTEKKLLYEALYKELPENAKILFPESNPKYLATRGTVASLLRLKRDPRFTPGSTLLKLMYKDDKDNSIKFFEGTNFTKKPTFNSINYIPNQQQATGKTSLSFFERPYMENSPKTVVSLNTETKSNLPPILNATKAMRAADNDVAMMNSYHDANVAAYNKATGSNIRSVPFRTDAGVTGRQVKLLPDDEFNMAYMERHSQSNSPTSDVKNVGGFYSRKDDIVYLRQSGSPSNDYHEFLHSNDYGITNPEVTKWRIDQLVDPEKIKNLSPANRSYYLSEVEFPVHLRQQGEAWDIKVGDPFPGEKVFDKMLFNRGHGGASMYVKGMDINAPLEDKKLAWRALNGTLFNYVIPIGVGLGVGYKASK